MKIEFIQKIDTNLYEICITDKNNKFLKYGELYLYNSENNTIGGKGKEAIQAIKEYKDIYKMFKEAVLNYTEKEINVNELFINSINI